MINLTDKELLSLFKGFLKANLLGMQGINTIGNKQVLTYYSGVTPENPSGISNLQKIEYYQNDNLILVENYTYDANNNITEILTTNA